MVGTSLLFHPCGAKKFVRGLVRARTVYAAHYSEIIATNRSDLHLLNQAPPSASTPSLPPS
jgi:hypothetical protein